MFAALVTVLQPDNGDVSCVTDSKAQAAATAATSKPMTTQNGSSLSLLGAYSDSDSNDSE